MLIWGLVDDLVLQPTVPDQHKWKLSISGTYSSRSAYNAFFLWKHQVCSLEAYLEKLSTLAVFFFFVGH
jgi:hypothetical protein